MGPQLFRGARNTAKLGNWHPSTMNIILSRIVDSHPFYHFNIQVKYGVVAAWWPDDSRNPTGSRTTRSLYLYSPLAIAMYFVVYLYLLSAMYLAVHLYICLLLCILSHTIY